MQKAELVQVRFTLTLDEGPLEWVCECKMDGRSIWILAWHRMGHVSWSLGFLHGIEWVMFRGHLDFFQKPPLGGRPNTKLGDHGTPNTHNRWFILLYHVWGPAWIEIHWNSIWLRARSHVTSHYTWGPATTLHDFGGVLGRPLDTCFWALTVSRSQLLAHVWSGPKVSFH